MMSKLDQLEAKLQALVENQLTSILPGLKNEDRVIQKLASALKQNIIEHEDNKLVAPNVFTLIVGNDSAPMWREPRAIEALKNIISSVGGDVGLKFESQPTITITTDDFYSPEEVSIIASHKLEPVEDTKGMATKTQNDPESNNTIPENAFLIVEGVKVHPLKETV